MDRAFHKLAIRAAVLAAVALTTQPAFGQSSSIGESSAQVGNARPGSYSSNGGGGVAMAGGVIDKILAACNAAGGGMVLNPDGHSACVDGEGNPLHGWGHSD